MAEGTKNVLILYAKTRLLPATIEVDRGFRQFVHDSANLRVTLFNEFIDSPLFVGEGYERTLVRYLREKYAAHKLDVVVASGTDALRFLLEHRDETFPKVPVVHMGVFQNLLELMSPLPADVIGVPFSDDFSKTIELALRLHPRVTRLVVITGTSKTDREWETQLRDEVSRFQDRVTIEFLAGLPTSELQKRLAELGSDSFVFTPGYFKDGAGRIFFPRGSVELMAAVATAPIYGPFNTFLGTGIVGGWMTNFSSVGRQAGRIVSNLIEGSAPAALRLPAVTPVTLNIDWRQVVRWGISEAAIPPSAIVHFKPPSLLEAHRTAVTVAASVILLQSVLIGWLVLEHHRRRLAEQTVYKHRAELAHASRLAMAGELTASIAHEINQPLGAILSNADAAEMLIESGTERRDDLRAILTDIRRDDQRASDVIRRLRSFLAKHDVEKQLFDVNEAVNEIVGIMRTDTRRRGILLDVRLAKETTAVLGDRTQFQRVLVNLILNAMQAVADLPEGRRKIVVSAEKFSDSVRISVRDRGPGISTEHLPKVFDSFFSTKSSGMGIGLSIARTLVEAHGGRIWVENDFAEGAAFRFELPAANTDHSDATGPS